MEFDYRVLCGDAIEKLKNIPQNSIDCCITSPPYYALRNYGHELQIGMESTPAEYVRKLVAVFEEVQRTMKKCGTLWVNIGDTYAGTGDKKGETNIDKKNPNRNGQKTAVNRNVEGCKRKDMIGI